MRYLATIPLLFTVCAVLLFVSTTTAEEAVASERSVLSSFREKRQLPLSTSCDPRQKNVCNKGDLVDSKVADCEKTSSPWTCNPVVNLSEKNLFDSLVLKFSSIVDVPDVSKHGVDCVPDTSLPITCGAEGTDTRCVCDKAVDYKRLKETLLNQCRCQYWPKVDVRRKRPSYCTQYDNGGTSRVHFYTCCNNCNDFDQSCNSKDYQGGGSKGDYCGDCGERTTKGGGRETYSYNCVSCEQQRRCEEKCDKEGFGIIAKIPGFCPKWARCFRECCIEADRRLSAILQRYIY